MTKSNRGFASLSLERRREIASKGGKAAHKSGHAHEWTSSEASKAGKLGGANSRKNYKRNSVVKQSNQTHESSEKIQ